MCFRLFEILTSNKSTDCGITMSRKFLSCHFKSITNIFQFFFMEHISFIFRFYIKEKRNQSVCKFIFKSSKFRLVHIIINPQDVRITEPEELNRLQGCLQDERDGEMSPLKDLIRLKGRLHEEMVDAVNSRFSFHHYFHHHHIRRPSVHAF